MQKIQLQVEVTGDRSLLAMLREKRAEILAIAAHHGAYHVRVFGLVGRGEDGPDGRSEGSRHGGRGEW